MVYIVLPILLFVFYIYNFEKSFKIYVGVYITFKLVNESINTLFILPIIYYSIYFTIIILSRYYYTLKIILNIDKNHKTMYF